MTISDIIRLPEGIEDVISIIITRKASFKFTCGGKNEK